MAWFGGISKITDQISNIAKEVLIEGTEEIDDADTALKVAKSKISEIERESTSQQIESERNEIDLRNKLESLRIQYAELSEKYEHCNRVKDEEIQNLEKNNQDLVQSSMTEISLDDSASNQFVSGDVHDFDDVITGQREITKLRAIIARFQMNERQRKSKKDDGQNEAQLSLDYQQLKEKLFKIQDENQETIASLQFLSEQRFNDQKQFYDDKISYFENQETKIRDLEARNLTLNNEISEKSINSVENKEDKDNDDIKMLRKECSLFKIQKDNWLAEKANLEKTLEDLRSGTFVDKDMENELKQAKIDRVIGLSEISKLQESLKNKTETFEFRLKQYEDDYDLELSDKDDIIDSLEKEIKDLKIKSKNITPTQTTSTKKDISNLESENKLNLERISELSKCLQTIQATIFTDEECTDLDMNSINEIQSNLCKVIKEKLTMVKELNNTINTSNEIKKDQENTINLLNDKIQFIKNDYDILKEKEEPSIQDKYESIIKELKNSILDLEDENKMNCSELNNSIDKIKYLTNCQDESKISYELLQEDNKKYEESIKEYNSKLQNADVSYNSIKESLDCVNENYSICEKELCDYKNAKINDDRLIQEYNDKLQISESKLSDTLKELDIIDASNVSEDIILEKDETITNLKHNLSVNNGILNSIKDILCEKNEFLDDDKLHDYLKTYITNFESNISDISTQLDEAKHNLNESSQHITHQEEQLAIANHKIEDLTMNMLDSKPKEESSEEEINIPSIKEELEKFKRENELLHDKIAKYGDLECDNMPKHSGTSSSSGSDFELLDKQHDAALLILECELSEAKSQLSDANSQISQVTDELCDKNIELREAKSQIISAEDQLTEAKRNLDEAKSELMNTQTQLSAVSEQLNKLTSDHTTNQDLLEKLSDASSQISNLNHQLEQLQTRCNQHDINELQLSEKCTSLQDQEQRLVSDREIAEDQVKKLEIKLTSSNNDNLNLQSQLEFVKIQSNIEEESDKVREMDNKLSLVNKEKLDLQSVLNEKISELTIHKNEMHRMNAKINMLDQELQQSKYTLENTTPSQTVSTDDMSRDAVKQLSKQVRARDLELEALRCKCDSLSDILKTNPSSANTPSSTSDQTCHANIDNEALTRLVNDRDEQQRLAKALSEERVTIVTALNNKHQEAIQFHAEACKQLAANQELVKELEQLRWSYEKQTRIQSATQKQLVSLQQSERRVDPPLDTVDHDEKIISNEISQLQKSSNVDLENQLANSELLITNLKEELTKYKHRFREIESRSELAEDQIESEERKYILQINNLKGELDYVNNDKNELHEKSSKEIYTLKEYINNCTGRIKQLEFELITAVQEKDSFNECQDSNNEQLNTTLGQVKALQRDREQLLINLKQYEDSNLQIKSQLEEKHDQLIKAEREVQRLRCHLVAIEENYTKDIVECENREVNLRSRLSETEKQLEISLHQTKNASAVSSDRVNGLTSKVEILTKNLERSNIELKNSKQKETETSLSLTNLQLVLQQFQKERDVQQTTETQRYKKELHSAKKDYNELNNKLKLVQNDLKEKEQAVVLAKRLSSEIDQKQLQISAFKEQINLKENELIEKDQTISNLKISREAKIEKTLIKNMLIGYFNSPIKKQKEVLKLICKMLNFSDDEISQIDTEHESGWMSKMFNTEKSKPNVDGSFSELFVQFLESESTPIKAPALEINKRRTSEIKVPPFSMSSRSNITGSSSSTAPASPSIPLQIPLQLNSTSSSTTPVVDQFESAESTILRNVLDN